MFTEDWSMKGRFLIVASRLSTIAMMIIILSFFHCFSEKLLNEVVY